ncbi:hypothetical protein U1Q18_000465 [Sarracenia purpurea var. burkii]
MPAARNGVYVNVVKRVREAFQTDEVARLDCAHVGASDCKKIGVKLRSSSFLYADAIEGLGALCPHTL